ncbi:kinesin motor domain-containing protein [Lasiosphaeria miniovina]|uniref:Kinesin motor domain-containing protein n=1 Tax=Lasiosphaeria miniovina TaxID=1954250 RepID=A0AA40EGM3_9PEZI|nr:kinesin motor domain-containing protein [Lasiosphaeria miniovina]KAK0734793.1 kinesin motor domain-containing protein [Lasiosphaeria miniovina]
MRPPSRTTSSTRQASSTRQPPSTRQPSSARPGRQPSTSRPGSPDSVLSAGGKRKDRDFETDEGEATNINVVVRCRGRNQREVRENSAVVVRTEGVKGKLVGLAMGPAALSDKTYNFDRVFSPAADQSMIFDDVVKPILDEMLEGYNCTIFAYGQTGTGKTYTMSGDMSDTMGMLGEEAGIIPRVLDSLFNRLEMDDRENCVRCSFIELYNEELRDLLSAEDNAKLKIYDDNSRKGHQTTVVQGMEERHITSATDGLRWLQEGSVRRQVAATKCNDLSSRSHTVFTITVHVKRETDKGEDYLMAGKLNLVDLAGSENIQRSGAENKRAAEAGLINKSLLTLGRVINALVDRSAHIPYRESKLTRLLQDSLGGRTKTCIIATVSPAKSNLEETISTLDYAFRAKNIRNKPQLNALLNKKTLLREFTAEIERLKGELIATRQRNGVYLSNEAYEDLSVQNESRRILTEEQGAKIETLESNLRNKVHEFFTLTSSFVGLKKEHDATRALLDETAEVLDQTELVLAATRKALAEEAHLRRAHQATEERLAAVGSTLLSTLQRTVGDVGGLHAKNKRKSDLQHLNRSTWAMSQAQVTGVTELVEGRIDDLRRGQERHIAAVTERVGAFVRDELGRLSSTQAGLDAHVGRLADAQAQLLAQRRRSKDDMDGVLGEIKVVRDAVQQRVGGSLQAISGAAERIAGGVLSELAAFHGQLHASYSAVGKDFKAVFDDLLQRLADQRAESARLRLQLEGAGRGVVQASAAAAKRIGDAVDEERRQAAAERQQLLAQITALVNSQAELHEERLTAKTAQVSQAVAESGGAFEGSLAQYSADMDAWGERDARLVDEVAQSRDAIKNRLKDDWTAANQHSTAIQTTTQSVHAETVRVVDAQIRDLGVQMRDLDDFVARARQHNAAHHKQHAEAVHALSTTIEGAMDDVAGRFRDGAGRAQALGDDVVAEADELRKFLGPALDTAVCLPLASLREDMQTTGLREYEPTGDTPQKTQYRYPTELPHTAPHDALLAELRDNLVSADADAAVDSPPARAFPATVTPTIFSDTQLSPADPSANSPQPLPKRRHTTQQQQQQQHRDMAAKNTALSMSLREVNLNVTGAAAAVASTSASLASTAFDHASLGVATLPAAAAADSTLPLLKRSTRSRPTRLARKVVASVAEGVENMPPVDMLGGGRRKSPRLQQ